MSTTAPETAAEDQAERELREAVQALYDADTNVYRLARRARRQGLTWDRIAAAVGVSRQTAYARYAERPDD